jgi:hypothetical protein
MWATNVCVISAVSGQVIGHICDGYTEFACYFGHVQYGRIFRFDGILTGNGIDPHSGEVEIQIMVNVLFDITQINKCRLIVRSLALENDEWEVVYNRWADDAILLTYLA